MLGSKACGQLAVLGKGQRSQTEVGNTAGLYHPGKYINMWWCYSEGLIVYQRGGPLGRPKKYMHTCNRTCMYVCTCTLCMHTCMMNACFSIHFGPEAKLQSLSEMEHYSAKEMVLQYRGNCWPPFHGQCPSCAQPTLGCRSHRVSSWFRLIGRAPPVNGPVTGPHA